MTNRCDSVDALMYAYCDFMRIKEENQMLEKNKDYVEMRVSSTDCAFTQNEPTSICIDGYVYTSYMNLPDPGEFYILISKEKFEKLQTNAGINAELARQWEINYDLLLKKTGFDTVEELVDYIHDPFMISPEDKTLREIIDECEEDYISERDKAEELQKENEQLKKKLEEFSPVPGYGEFLKALYPEATEETIEKLVWTTKHIVGCCPQQNPLQTDLEYYRAISSAQAKSIVCWKEATGCSTPEEAKELIDGNKRQVTKLQNRLNAIWGTDEELKKKSQEYDPLPDFRELLKKLYSTNDVENLEWTLNHVCGGRGSVNGWIAVSSFWKQKYETLSKLVGFVTVEETLDYLTNEAECDTLHEAILKLKDQVKYTCDEWYSANSRNNSWKAAAECNSPKELMEKIEGLEGKIKVLDRELKIHTKALQEWKDGTGCPSPSAAKTLIESGASWHHAHNEIKEVNRKLGDNIKSWQNVTGHSTPEDYLRSRINAAITGHIEWQKATGCNSPEEVETTMRNLRSKIDEIKEFAAIASNWTDRIVED